MTEIEFLDGYADGTLTPSIELRRDITRAIRRFRPDRILTTSPLRRWERIAGPSHPDHLAVGEATTCAIYPDARNPFAFPELLARRAWSRGSSARSGTWAARAPTTLVDVTDTYPPSWPRCGGTPPRPATSTSTR